MNLFSPLENLLRVAVPNYGSRVLPRFGQAREFCFAEIDRRKRVLCRLERRCWNLDHEPDLGRWLVREGVAAVLCGGIHPRFQTALIASGIAVFWGFRGEVEEVLRDWLSRGEEALEASVHSGSATQCGQPRRMVCEVRQHRNKGGKR